jgi:hypothetical protein
MKPVMRKRWGIVIVMSLILMLMSLTLIIGCSDSDDATQPSEEVEKPQEAEDAGPSEPSNTPDEAVDAYLDKEGMDESKVELTEKVSEEDPTWAIYTGTDDVGDSLTIILHVEDGEWTVVEAGSSFPEWPPDIPGAPDDLFE